MPVGQRPLLFASETTLNGSLLPLDENWSISLASDIDDVRRQAAEVVARPLPDVDLRLKSGIRWLAFTLFLVAAVAFTSTSLVASLKGQLDDRQNEQECRSRINNAAGSRNLEAEANFRQLVLKRQITPDDPAIRSMAVAQVALDDRVAALVTPLRDAVTICGQDPTYIPR